MWGPLGTGAPSPDSVLPRLLPVQPSQAPKGGRDNFFSSPLDPGPYPGFGQPLLSRSEAKKAFFLIQRVLGPCHTSRSRRQAPLPAPGR